MRVTAAPEARDLFWHNLHLTAHQKRIRRGIVVLLVSAIIIFFVVPVSWFNSYLSTAALKKHRWFRALVTGRPLVLTLSSYIMPLALTALCECVPGILTFLAIFEGVLSWSKNQMRQMDRYFAFLMINVFLVVTIGGAIVAVAEEIADHPREIFTLLGESLPTMSGFFFEYMMLRGVAGNAVTLVRAGSIAQTLFKSTFIPNLSRRNLIEPVVSLRAWSNPGWYSYGKSYGNLLLGLVVLLCYAPLAPMILVCLVLYFGMTWFVTKYVYLYVFEYKFETGGAFFPRLYPRVFVCLALAQATVTGVMICKAAYMQAWVCGAMMLISFIAEYTLGKEYDDVIQYLPLEVATSLDLQPTWHGAPGGGLSTPGGGDDEPSEARKRKNAGEGLDDPDALEAARQYTQPALIAERTARPEVELDSFPPGEPVPLLRRLGMANPELMCPPGGSLLRRSGAGGR